MKTLGPIHPVQPIQPIQTGGGRHVRVRRTESATSPSRITLAASMWATRRPTQSAGGPSRNTLAASVRGGSRGGAPASTGRTIWAGPAGPAAKPQTGPGGPAAQPRHRLRPVQLACVCVPRCAHAQDLVVCKLQATCLCSSLCVCLCVCSSFFVCSSLYVQAYGYAKVMFTRMLQTRG